MLTFNIQSEFDLQSKVANFVRNRYPKALLTATLGENQTASDIRLNFYKMGNSKGSPDLIIQNLHKNYNGFVIEFETPRGNGVLSKEQDAMLKEYRDNNYKVLLTNNYDDAIIEINEYFHNVGIIANTVNGNSRAGRHLTII